MQSNNNQGPKVLLALRLLFVRICVSSSSQGETKQAVECLFRILYHLWTSINHLIWLCQTTVVIGGTRLEHSRSELRRVFIEQNLYLLVALRIKYCKPQFISKTFSVKDPLLKGLFNKPQVILSRPRRSLVQTSSSDTVISSQFGPIAS